MFRFWPRAVLLAFTWLCTACSTTFNQAKTEADVCFTKAPQDFSQVLACYRTAQAKVPLKYVKAGVTQVNGIEKRSYELTSQSWSPGNRVTPEKWMHTVDAYIPSHALPSNALLVLNNGSNYGSETNPAKGSTDFTDEDLRALAIHTRTIVISVSHVPNQYLSYQDDGKPRREDDSVAYSWKLFLEAPEQRPFIPLQVPMMEVAVKAMDLVQKELKPWQIDRFIATGISKRGWTVWHAALADTRIAAIVPFVADQLNFNEVLEHTYQVYGKNWPIAFMPYYREGIDQALRGANFQKLMEIADPLHYLKSAQASRLAIPKYIVNTSGDDFFVPDNARLYIDKLPGATALRVAPNAAHAGVKQYTQQALVTFVNRMQRSQKLPALTNELKQDGTNATLSVKFSEVPAQIIQWTAVNPAARDFRYACGVNYTAQALELGEKQNSVQVSIKKPESGWQAIFIEAHFKDGFVATTPVYVLPDTVYPISAPPSKESICKTLPGN